MPPNDTPDPAAVKVCTKCGEAKSAECFAPRRWTSDGLQGHCRTCRATYAKAYYTAHREEMIATATVRSAMPGPAAKARRRENAKRRYLEQREKAAQYQREYLARPGVAEERKRKAKAWRDKNPHKMTLYNARHERRMREAPGSFTDEQLAGRIQMWGGSCWICGNPADTIDHVIPVSRGGTNWPANLRPACRSCNCKKHNRDWRIFA